MSGERPCGMSLDSRGAAGRPPWIGMQGSRCGVQLTQSPQLTPECVRGAQQGFEQRSSCNQLGAILERMETILPWEQLGSQKALGQPHWSMDIPAQSRFSIPPPSPG